MGLAGWHKEDGELFSIETQVIQIDEANLRCKDSTFQGAKSVPPVS